MTHCRARIKGQGNYTLALKKTTQGLQAVSQEYGFLWTAWEDGVKHCVQPFGWYHDQLKKESWLLMRYTMSIPAATLGFVATCHTSDLRLLSD